MSLGSWLGKIITLRSTAFWAVWGGRDNASGETVTPDNSMQLPALARGVRLTATTAATLPRNVYETDGKGGDATLVRDPTNAYDNVIRGQPNEDQTDVEFWEAMIGAMVLVGNAYARKHKAGGKLVALEYLADCEPYRTTNYALRYRGNDAAVNKFDLPASDVFHLKGFSFGGDLGMSIVQYGIQSLGTLKAANKVSARIMGGGLASSNIVTTPGILNEGDRPRFQKIIDDFAASTNPSKILLLEGGANVTRMGLSAADAQLLAQTHFGIEEIARWLDMPAILLGHTDESTTNWGTGVEAIIQSWYTLGLRALLTRVEKAINKRLIEPADRARFYVKFNVDGLLRGDSAAQANLFSTYSQNAIMTRNEIRKLLELPPLPGGDVLTLQVNMALLDGLGAVDESVANNARLALLQFLGEREPPKQITQAAA